MKYTVNCKVKTVAVECEGPGAQPRANGRSLTGALGTALCYIAMLYCTVLYITALLYYVLYNTALFHSIMYCTLQY